MASRPNSHLVPLCGLSDVLLTEVLLSVSIITTHWAECYSPEPRADVVVASLAQFVQTPAYDDSHRHQLAAAEDVLNLQKIINLMFSFRYSTVNTKHAT